MIVCDVCRSEPARVVEIRVEGEFSLMPEHKVGKRYDLCKICTDRLCSQGWSTLAERRKRYLQASERNEKA